jgi:hypothetical protein
MGERSRHVFFGLALSLAFALLAVQAPACGSTDDTTTGGDAVADSPVDTGPLDSATCDLSANLLDKIPDAAIADGASTTGVCLGCANANCGDTITKCNESCPCQTTVSSGLACYLRDPANAQVCALSLIGGNVDSNVQGLAFGLLNCVQAHCDQECQASKLSDAGGD